MTDDLVKHMTGLLAAGLDRIEQLERELSISRMAQVVMDNGAEALSREVKNLKKLVFAAYCEGFHDGKDGGWIVGPTNQPWKLSDTHKVLVRMEANDV